RTDRHSGEFTKDWIAAVPMLMFTIRMLYLNRLAITQFNAAITLEIVPTPCEFRARRLIKRAPGAIPAYLPLYNTPEPAISEATNLPWPYGSSVRCSPVKSTLTIVRPAALSFLNTR